MAFVQQQSKENFPEQRGAEAKVVNTSLFYIFVYKLSCY